MNIALLSEDSGLPSNLKGSLDRIAAKLRTRVGLVPNYFMTRGEAIGPQETFTSFETVGRRAIERAFKLFHKSDFREEQLYEEFEQIMTSTRIAVASDGSLSNAVAEMLNRQQYKDGNTLLHLLVERRHLRFVRTLLLNVGEMLDLDLRNRHGYRALDLAFDRLEVEMVFLLLLHGASDNSARINKRSSLGYGFWIMYDMVQNLDTGRWLHKHSEQAIMKHAEFCFRSEMQVSLLEWARDGGTMSTETLSQVGRMPSLFTIVLADGCDAITNNEAWATLIRHVRFLRGSNGTRQRGNQGVQKLILPDAVPCNDLYGYLKARQVDVSSFRSAGRTIFFLCLDGTDMAVKFSKSLEDAKVPHPLAKEAAMNSQFADFKHIYGLRSQYPVTVALVRLSHVPEAIRHAIKRQQVTGYHPFELTADKDGVTALIYRPPGQYSVYANDPSLPLDECRSGIEKAGYDSAVLARQGLYHSSLIDIQHDASREQRPHLWSYETFLTRFRGGAGRIERGFAGLAAPNVRASGLADLKHILTVEQVVMRYDPSIIHAQHNILYSDEERTCVCEIEQLGSSLFATALLVASSWQSRYEEGGTQAVNLDLSLELRNCFCAFLQGYLQIDKEKAERFFQLIDADFDRMASQVRMFATSNYVKIAETAPPRPIFGICAKLLGWLTHPTAFVHFLQRGSMDLTTSRGRCLPEMQEVYQDGTSEFPRVDTSMMACSPTWVRGQGWVNRKGQKHLGSYEGVLPFQQLVRDLYVTVHLAWLAHLYGIESFEVFAT
jgi:hypothetical protein